MIAGVDLAGSEKQKTGLCLLTGRLYCRTEVLHTDGEIVERVRAARPKVVSIDAPLFLPRGRTSIEERGPPHFRACDRELQKMKIRFFPISLGPMRLLTARGMKLRAALEGIGLTAVESFPGAIQDILGLPRKQRGLEALRESLIAYGIRGDVAKADITDHELDAITSALVGKMYVDGSYTAIGDPEEGLMILPPLKRR